MLLGWQLPRTYKSVQKWKETEFHIKSFLALHALVPIIGWDNWIYVESLLMVCYLEGCDIFFAISLLQLDCV